MYLPESSLPDWFETANTVTGLYPFMSSLAKNIEEVCEVATMTLPTEH
jgi:hypothetical protein